MSMNEQINAAIRQALTPYVNEVRRLASVVAGVQQGGGAGVTDPAVEALARIKGRRVFFHLVASQTFTTSQDGVRGSAMNFLVSQDGPFVMTHYPLVMWRGSLPTNGTLYGMWKPLYSWPLPVQQIAAAGTLLDTINISWELNDAGSQVNFQTAAVPPLFSRPDNLLPLPQPTLLRENTTVQFTPTYHDINFESGSTDTTEGTLVVALPGYRILTGRTGNF